MFLFTVILCRSPKSLPSCLNIYTSSLLTKYTKFVTLLLMLVDTEWGQTILTSSFKFIEKIFKFIQPYVLDCQDIYCYVHYLNIALWSEEPGGVYSAGVALFEKLRKLATRKHNNEKKSCEINIVLILLIYMQVMQISKFKTPKDDTSNLKKEMR